MRPKADVHLLGERSSSTTAADRRSSRTELRGFPPGQRSSYTDNWLTDRQIADAVAWGEGDAAPRVQAREVTGYGSNVGGRIRCESTPRCERTSWQRPGPCFARDRGDSVELPCSIGPATERGLRAPHRADGEGHKNRQQPHHPG